MDKTQLKDLIERVLKDIDLYSPDAVNLILGTAAQESGMGKYIRQLGTGPALGIFQMEPNTFKDIYQNFIHYKELLQTKIEDTCNVWSWVPETLEYNLAFAICLTRVHYLRVNETLPNTIEGYAYYWKKYYNTYLGAGTEQEFIRNYKKYVL